MTRSALPGPVGGRWAGLTLELAAPARPGLRVEVAPRRRLLVRQSDQVVMMARQRARNRGVHYARTGRYRSPLPPVGAALARQLRTSTGDGQAWAARWTHRFIDWLQAAADGPLHAGRWTLAWGMPNWCVAAHWRRLLADDPDQGHIAWFDFGDPPDDGRDVLPLRRLSPVDAARVRSYRRQRREGILPPALLWWVSGLQTLIVLDGHDRIAAALADDGLPEVVVLAPADPWLAELQRRPVREYEGRVTHLHARAAQGDTAAAARIGAVSRRYADELGDLARREGRTRAWPLPGGERAWAHHVATLAPSWSAGS